MITRIQALQQARENMAAMAEERETPHAYLFLGSGKPVFGSHWVFVLVGKQSGRVDHTLITNEAACRAEFVKAYQAGVQAETV